MGMLWSKDPHPEYVKGFCHAYMVGMALFLILAWSCAGCVVEARIKQPTHTAGE